MKLINLLIRELDNCSLGGDFRVSRHAEICQFDRFSLEINFKRARSCNYGIPRLVQVKMKTLLKQKIGENSSADCLRQIKSVVAVCVEIRYHFKFILNETVFTS